MLMENENSLLVCVYVCVCVCVRARVHVCIRAVVGIRTECCAENKYASVNLESLRKNIMSQNSWF